MWLWLCIAGCGRWEAELVVADVVPEVLHRGDEVRVRGEGFDAHTTVAFKSGSEVTPLSVSLEGDTLVGSMPPLPEGAYSLIVSRGDRRVVVPVEVRAAVEAPCGRTYTANTQVSLAEGLAIIDRFHADGSRERVETPIADIVELRYVESPLTEGRVCSAILLKKSDGATLLFEDAIDSPLRARAETLSRFLEKRLVTP